MPKSSEVFLSNTCECESVSVCMCVCVGIAYKVSLVKHTRITIRHCLCASNSEWLTKINSQKFCSCLIDKKIENFVNEMQQMLKEVPSEALSIAQAAIAAHTCSPSLSLSLIVKFNICNTFTLLLLLFFMYFNCTA